MCRCVTLSQCLCVDVCCTVLQISPHLVFHSIDYCQNCPIKGAAQATIPIGALIHFFSTLGGPAYLTSLLIVIHSFMSKIMMVSAPVPDISLEWGGHEPQIVRLLAPVFGPLPRPVALQVSEDYCSLITL